MCGARILGVKALRSTALPPGSLGPKNVKNPSLENREETLIICQEIMPALAAQHTDDVPKTDNKIVIITLYKAQQKLLDLMLA